MGSFKVSRLLMSRPSNLNESKGQPLKEVVEGTGRAGDYGGGR